MSTAVISMIIVDITPEESRYYNKSHTNKHIGKLLTLYRIICFYSIGAAVTIANLLAFPLGSWLLPQDMWLQYIVSFIGLFAAFLVAFVIPETRKTKRRTENSIHATDHGHQVIPYYY
jgi:MFS family permease